MLEHYYDLAFQHACNHCTVILLAWNSAWHLQSRTRYQLLWLLKNLWFSHLVFRTRRLCKNNTDTPPPPPLPFSRKHSIALIQEVSPSLELVHSALTIVTHMCCGVTAKEEPEGFGEGWQRQDVIVGLQNIIISWYLGCKTKNIKTNKKKCFNCLSGLWNL